MDANREMELQSLIDLLAKETEKYTKACVARIPQQISLHKATVESLIAEIYRRKKESRSPNLWDGFHTNFRKLADH